MPTKTAQIRGLVPGQGSNYTINVLGPDGTEVVQSAITGTETGMGTGIYDFPITAAVTTATYAITLFNLTANLGGLNCDLAEVTGLYLVIDGSTPLMISADFPTAGEIAAALAALGSVSIEVVSPLSQDGQTLELVTGNSYTVANGRSLTFQITNQPSLVGSIPRLRIQGFTGDFAVGPAIVSETQQIVMNDVLATTTAMLPSNPKQPTTLGMQITFTEGIDAATPLLGFAKVFQGY